MVRIQLPAYKIPIWQVINIHLDMCIYYLQKLKKNVLMHSLKLKYTYIKFLKDANLNPILSEKV